MACVCVCVCGGGVISPHGPFFFLRLYCPTGIFPMGNSGLFSPLPPPHQKKKSQPRQSRATHPTVHTGCFSVSIMHRTLTWTTRYLTCTQMLVHAISHGGCTDTVRESALKVDSRRKNPLPQWKIEPASAACRSDALPTELHPHPFRCFVVATDSFHVDPLHFWTIVLSIYLFIHLIIS